MKATQDNQGRFIIEGPATAQELMELAANYYQKKLGSTPITCSREAVDFFRTKIGHLEHEIFAVLFLDQRHRVIAYKELFRGTLNAAAVYPREIVKEALKHNAAAILMAHNHPSGITTASEADIQVTRRIIDAAGLLEIRVLDHLIVSVSEERYESLSEKGLM